MDMTGDMIGDDDEECTSEMEGMGSSQEVVTRALGFSPRTIHMFLTRVGSYGETGCTSFHRLLIFPAEHHFCNNFP
jgi:hypothetical protein